MVFKKIFKKVFLPYVMLLCLPSTGNAASMLEGNWRLIDSLGNIAYTVNIFETETGSLSAKIIKNDAFQKKCIRCKGALKNKTIEGMVIATGLLQVAGNPRKYDNGNMLTIKSGTYHKIQATITNSDLHVISDDKRINQLWKRIETE